LADPAFLFKKKPTEIRKYLTTTLFTIITSTIHILMPLMKAVITGTLQNKQE
jgi:hypothetical protein